LSVSQRYILPAEALIKLVSAYGRPPEGKTANWPLPKGAASFFPAGLFVIPVKPHDVGRSPREVLLMRKPIALFLLGFVATTSHAENRSSAQSTSTAPSKDVVPRSYLIHLEPNIETRITDGVESIEIEVLKPTKRIVLNALETQIAKATIEVGEHAEELIPRFDLSQQTVSFDLPNELPPGSFTLSIKFQSRIIEAPLFARTGGPLAPSNTFWQWSFRHLMPGGSSHVGMNRHFRPDFN
jgi:Peptidase M1 N-terminal domain